MARSQHRSRRKVSGGLYHHFRTKKRQELAGLPAETKLDATARIKQVRVRGGQRKQKILSINTVNVSDQAGKTTKTEILNVVENPANPHLVRRNIITKGAVVETKLGKVRITSRPGQEGSVSGLLVK
jgi:small subunit ribosomal protein S8e